MPEEQSERKYNIDELMAEVARRTEVDRKAFDAWLANISQERRKKYEELRVFSSDVKDKEFVFRKCRFALELVDSLKSDDGRRVLPVGLAIHGTNCVVFIQAEGHETVKGRENFNELVYVPPDKTGEEVKWFCDVNTDEYGVPTTDAGVFKFRLDKEEVRKRLSGMS